MYPIRPIVQPPRIHKTSKDASTHPPPLPPPCKEEEESGRPDGGAFLAPSPSSSSSSSKSSCHGDFPLRVNYCPANPCLTREIHCLHKQVLDGLPGADVRLNGMLAVCAMLLPPPPSPRKAGDKPANNEECTAHLVLECICGDPRHDIALQKRNYVHQFHHWKRCDFASSPAKPLRIPISSLITPLGATPQYSLLPDLGQFVHRALLKRYFTDQSRRHWLRTATSHQVLGGFIASPPVPPTPLSPSLGASSSSSSHPPVHAQHVPSFSRPVAETAGSFAAERWKPSAMLCTSLLHDSFPCLKKTKRAPMPGASSSAAAAASNSKHRASDDEREDDEDDEAHPRLFSPARGSNNNKRSSPQKKSSSAAAHSETHAYTKAAPVYDPVDVAACINVLYGTLLKLYPLGAKVPTFNARVVVMSRLMHLSSLPTDQKVEFLMQHPALVRLCFMEYSLNALMDWLPCERQLFCSICPPMKVYSSVAVAVCDVFRQDHLTTGSEDWAALNRAALSSIDRCIRVCKFKALKTSEISFKFQHVDAGTFHRGALDLPLLQILGDDAAASAAPLSSEAPPGAPQGGKKAASGTAATKKRGRAPSASSSSTQHQQQEQHQASPNHPEETQKLLLPLVEALAAAHALPCSDAEALLRSCQTVQRSLRVYPLPVSVAWAQQGTLIELHSACSARMAAARRLSFCAVCAINGRGFQCKLRMCCLDGALSCITCPPGTVVTVDMLGVLLKVGCSSFYMCPCCTGLRVWNGDGSDMHAGQCTCWEFGSLRSALVAEAKLRGHKNDSEVARFAVQRSAHTPPQCLVCKSKSICTRAAMLLPDPARRVVRKVNLCARHAPPDHILCNVTGFSELVQAVRYYLANSTTSRRGHA